MSEAKVPSGITKAEMLESLKDAVRDLLTRELEGIAGDVTGYAADIARDFGRNVQRALAGADPYAAENLRDLKAQLTLLAVKRAIIIQHDSMDKLKQIVEIAFQVGIKVLVAAAIAA